MADNPRRRPAVKAAEEILTSSAQVLDGSIRQAYAIQYKNWMEELWAYTDSVGEYASAMNWFSSGIGRMHLRAARWKPEMREPELVDTGRPAELMQELALRARGGETQFLRSWGKHLFVPGVGIFLGEEFDGIRRYDVKSLDVVKKSTQTARDPETGEPVLEKDGRPRELFDIRIAPDQWRTTSPYSLIGRIFEPDPRYDYLPTSMTKAALTTLREIDLYNRAIVATLLSRIAFNGILLMPTEATFAVNKQFKDAPDPFIAELLHYAQRGIKDPGSPGAAIPFPIRVSGQHIEQFKHLILSSGLDPKIIDARESAVVRLKEQLPAPPEALSGLQDMNHWNAWKSSEDMVKLYFGPPMEVLCGGFTELFLHPMLKAERSPIEENGYVYIAWYDASDLTIQPDNSENAQSAFDSGQLSSDPYLEAMGFDPADKTKVGPDLREQILIKSAMAGTPLSDAFYLLFPEDKPEQPPTAVPGQIPAGESAASVGPSAAGSSTGETMPEKKRPTSAGAPV